MTRHNIDSETLYRCDCCGATKWLRGDELPLPWREFSKVGWVGKFVACSNACHEKHVAGTCGTD